MHRSLAPLPSLATDLDTPNIGYENYVNWSSIKTRASITKQKHFVLYELPSFNILYSFLVIHKDKPLYASMTEILVIFRTILRRSTEVTISRSHISAERYLRKINFPCRRVQVQKELSEKNKLKGTAKANTRQIRTNRILFSILLSLLWS